MNQAIQLLHQQKTWAEAVASLAVELGVSPRQAARYVAAAQQQSGPLAVPEPKEVFSVKLPKSLAARVRVQARTQARSLSEWVAEALERQLQAKVRHG